MKRVLLHRGAHRHGLTLLELLAATVILSAVAAMGATLLRDAREAAGRSAVSMAAARALQRWRVEERPAGASAEPWSWSDEAGRTWRITMTGGDDPDSSGSGTGATASMDQLSTSWRTVVVEFTGDSRTSGSTGSPTRFQFEVPIAEVPRTEEHTPGRTDAQAGAPQASAVTSEAAPPALVMTGTGGAR